MMKQGSGTSKSAKNVLLKDIISVVSS